MSCTAANLNLKICSGHSVIGLEGYKRGSLIENFRDMGFNGGKFYGNKKGVQHNLFL